MASAVAGVGSRRPRCHRQQQRHKRHAAELRVSVGVGASCPRLPRSSRRPPRPWCHRQQQRHKRHTSELRVAAGVAAFSMAAAGADVGSRRCHQRQQHPRCHQRQQQHKRHAAERIDSSSMSSHGSILPMFVSFQSVCSCLSLSPPRISRLLFTSPWMEMAPIRYLQQRL
jgi:hypothetical protein